MKKGAIFLIIVGLGLSLGHILSGIYADIIYRRNYVFDFLNKSFLIIMSDQDSRNYHPLFFYIQLIRENNEDDLNFFLRIAKSWQRPNIKLILVAQDPFKFASYFGLNNIFYLRLDHLSSHDKKMFYKRQYYLYGPKYKLLTSGTTENYDYSAKIELMKFVDGVYFNINEFLPKSNINDMDNFGGLHSILKNRSKEYYIVAFISNFNSSCGTGYLINELENISMLDNLDVVGILYSGNHDAAQLMYLRDQSQITFALILSDDILFTEWGKLINKYNDRIVNNIILFIDNEGNILKTFYPGEGLWNEFKYYVLYKCHGDRK